MHVTTNYFLLSWLQGELCSWILTIFFQRSPQTGGCRIMPTENVANRKEPILSETLGFRDEKLRALAVLLSHSMRHSSKWYPGLALFLIFIHKMKQSIFFFCTIWRINFNYHVFSKTKYCDKFLFYASKHVTCLSVMLSIKKPTFESEHISVNKEPKCYRYIITHFHEAVSSWVNFLFCYFWSFL